MNPFVLTSRNNQYAISTHVSEQTSGDHIAAKALSFGMKTMRVDGNDALAVFEAVKFAKNYIVENNMPVFLECMTYRIGDHSTSDHSLMYRDQSEIDFHKTTNNPIVRLGTYSELNQMLNYSSYFIDYGIYLISRKIVSQAKDNRERRTG